jgi:hypothetical protein
MSDDIHVVMCCWKRIENLEKQIININNQKCTNKINFHLLNNNKDNVNLLNDLIIKFSIKYTNINIYLSHYDNKYYSFQRFFYIRDILIDKYNIEYVIIIDDDQIYSNDWIQKMYNLRTPKTYYAWWCRKWNLNNIDYYNGNILNSPTSNKDDIYVHYGGPGGSIIDVSIFNKDSKLWEIPNDLPNNISVYNLDDVWLSFVVRKIYNWNIKRSFLPELLSLNVSKSSSDKQSLYRILTSEKQLLFKYLVNKYGFIDFDNKINNIPKKINNNFFRNNIVKYKLINKY